MVVGHILSDKAFFALRVYVLIPTGSTVGAAGLAEIVAHDLRSKGGRWHFAT
jgi:hypothetical protein